MSEADVYNDLRLDNYLYSLEKQKPDIDDYADQIRDEQRDNKDKPTTNKDEKGNMD